MKTKIIFRIIRIIIYLLLIFVAVNTTRNYLVITSIEEKIKPYKDITNVHYIISTDRTENVEYSEVYIKDNESKTIMIYKDNSGKTRKMIQTINNQERRNYSEVDGKKSVKVYKEDNGGIGIRPYFDNYLPWNEKLINCLTGVITEEKMDGKEYYVLNGFTTYYLYDQNAVGSKIYVNKETGIREKMIEKIKVDGQIKEYTMIYKYDFNKVTDKDLVPPELSEYEIQ